MRGLLIKDFMLMKRQKLFFAAMGIVCVCFLFLAERENIMVELLSYGFMLFAVNTAAIDDENNGTPFLLTLPVTRTTYVKEKYFLSGLCLCAAWLLSVGLAYLVHMGSAQNIPAPALQYCLENIVYLVFAFVMMAIILPIRLKYGYGETSKSFMVFALLALVAMICFGPELAQGIQQFSENYPAGSGFLQSLPFRVAFGIAVSLVSVMISYRVSIRVMDEKEY